MKAFDAVTDDIEKTAPNQLAACMSQAEQNMLRKYLSHARIYLEFGVGGSTGIAAEQPGLTIIGLDSHPDWIARCKTDPRIAKVNEDNRLTLHHVDIGKVGDWGYPVEPAAAQRWPRYSLDIWKKLGTLSPDFVFIDGRFRVSCLLQTLLNLPDVGHVLIHDFWDRPHYHGVLDFVDVIDRVGQLGVFKPKADMDLRALGKMASVSLMDAR